MSGSRIAGLALACAAVAAPLAAAGVANADIALITCTQPPVQVGPRLDITCHNPDDVPGNVSLMYACSTPVPFGDPRQFIFHEPIHPIAAGGDLHLVRNCPAGQVVVDFEAWPLTRTQQQANAQDQQTLRAQRDAEVGR